LNLPGDFVWSSRREIDLVDHRYDFEAGAEGQVQVSQRLGFNPLSCVDHQNCALARLKGAAYLVREVDVSRRVDEVEFILLSTLGPVGHSDGRGLDGNPLLSLKVHAVEDLLHHFALRDRAG